MRQDRTVEEMASSGQLDAQLDDLAERLVEEYRAVDAATVRSTVDDERERFADAKVHVFIPILVERGVRARLAHV